LHGRINQLDEPEVKQQDVRRTRNSNKPVGPVDSTGRSSQNLKNKLKKITELEDVEEE